VDAIHNAILCAGRSVGAVLVTGDLTYVGSPEEFAAAKEGLFYLTNGLLGLGLEHLVVVPGNHDITWSRDDAYNGDREVDTAPEEANANYREFFQNLYLFEASLHLSMARRYIFPGGNLLDVVGVNSSSLEQGKNFLAGMGRVQEPGYKQASQELGWESRRGLALRVLALHHHLALTDNLESASEYRKGFGIAVDAPRIMRMAAHDGVHVAMHGHKHRAFLWRSGVYELPEFTSQQFDLGNLNIIGGGSSGSASTEGNCNFFNLLRVSGCCVDLEMYRSKDHGVFEPFTSWQAPLVSGEHGLELGPWRQMEPG